MGCFFALLHPFRVWRMTARAMLGLPVVKMYKRNGEMTRKGRKLARLMAEEAEAEKLREMMRQEERIQGKRREIEAELDSEWASEIEI